MDDLSLPAAAMDYQRPEGPNEQSGRLLVHEVPTKFSDV
jgi:hypothetical protein